MLLGYGWQGISLAKTKKAGEAGPRARKGNIVQRFGLAVPRPRGKPRGTPRDAKKRVPNFNPEQIFFERTGFIKRGRVNHSANKKMKDCGHLLSPTPIFNFDVVD